MSDSIKVKTYEIQVTKETNFLGDERFYVKVDGITQTGAAKFSEALAIAEEIADRIRNGLVGEKVEKTITVEDV